ncbi:MAG: dihydropteroate synthase [Bacteroidales bacterium]|jgi:dihydropteroate synthase|nr:dihydropteroate synthase [Bacteroidales bacterium]MCI2121360.1 dihydropteroate synthase [Bacteroidales bacterium]MCI2145239.1 dihydropteroate synthase [Bacteroidales bacterium]
MTKRDIKVMGIVNVDDDSYYAPSRVLGSDQAKNRIALLLDEGAGIIDIGACSTRPGSAQPDEEKEWLRLEPVLKMIRPSFGNIMVSIDTYRSTIVEKAADILGNFIVNDISAGEADENMLPVVGNLHLTYIAMHMRGTPQTMQNLCEYGDVTKEVIRYFREFAVKAGNNGIKEYIIDPGFGFAKTVDQNYQLLAQLGQFKSLQRPILAALSRKSMIYKPLDISPEEALPATSALNMVALQNGADILRVHDVKEACQCIAMYNELCYFTK